MSLQNMLDKLGGKVEFMNSRKSPLCGEVTDLNVWNRILKEEEIEGYHQCEGITGNVVSWNLAPLNIVNLETYELHKSKVCSQKAERYNSFLTWENYRGSLAFCNSLGGDLAVADDQQQLDHMVTAFTLAGSLRGEESEAQYFYTGHTTGERETGWENDVNGELLAWNNWADGYPVSSRDKFRCAQSSSVHSWKFLSGACSTELRPICDFRNGYQSFKMFGIPERYQMNLDVYYFMTNSTYLTGYLRWDN